MTVKVHIDLGYEFEVKARAREVFDVLADAPISLSHFPKLHKVSDMGDGVYRCEMQKVGIAHANIQTVYASQYKSDRTKGSVVWTPVPDVGNAQVGGSWKITDHKGRSTKCVLKLDAAIDVPLPALMRSVVDPAVSAEFERLVDRYIDNLIQHFGGEVKD